MSKDSLRTFLIFARKISNATSDNFLRNRRAILGLRWVADKLIESISDKAMALKVAPWTDEKSEMGPVISREHKEKIEKYEKSLRYFSRSAQS